MTEAVWHSATIEQLINWSKRGLSVRLGRLLASGVCRVTWDRLPIPVRQAVPSLEMAADLHRVRPDLTSEIWTGLRELAGVGRGGLLTPERSFGLAIWGVLRADDHGITICREAALLAHAVSGEIAWLDTTCVHGIVRDIFGNPFRPAAFDPAWRTPTAVALASGMYESRDFGAMPILADALQDAGCDSDEVLGHCRGPGPHVCGCWVVDLVLGKE